MNTPRPPRVRRLALLRQLAHCQLRLLEKNERQQTMSAQLNSAEEQESLLRQRLKDLDAKLHTVKAQELAQHFFYGALLSRCSTQLRAKTESYRDLLTEEKREYCKIGQQIEEVREALQLHARQLEALAAAEREMLEQLELQSFRQQRRRVFR